MTGAVRLDVQGPLARVVLSHPGKFNAMSRAMWRELKAVFQGLAEQPGLRGVLLQGEGGHFCAGGDIAEYPGFRFDEASLRDFHENDVWGGLQAVLDCDVPVLAAIEGHCMGAGVEIASCCDIRLAGASARFGAPIARLGFAMAPREAQLVVAAVGALSAREMLLEAAVLDAPEMKLRGFLNQVLADEVVLDHARDRLLRLSALAPEAARATKRTLRALARREAWPDLLEDAYRYADSPEHREGITAFLEKRKPAF